MMIRLTITFLLLSLPITLAAGRHVDVHVHLRGTMTSGLLGNAGSQGRGQGPRRGPRSTGFQRRDSSSEQENLKKAAENLIRAMDRKGVGTALIVVVPNPKAKSQDSEYETAQSIVRQFPNRLKLLAGGATLSTYLQKVKPDAVSDRIRKKFRAKAESLLKEGAVGFGEMIAYHLSMAKHHSFQVAMPDHPLYLELADIAAENDVAIDLHMEAISKKRSTPGNLLKASSQNPRTLEPTIPALERLLEHNRKARIVWQHIGWDNTGDMTPTLIEGLLRRHKNLYLALRVENRTWQVGGGGDMPNRLVDERGRLTSEWREVIESHADRFVIGSDEFFFPVTQSKERPNQSFSATWALLDQLPMKLRRQLGGANATRIYNFR
ncbi:MAG: amidohydrolase family protein [Planctomycetota bacterium]|jgi:hypothetical protein